MPKWFHRDPAMILALVNSSIMMISSFVFHLTPDQQGTVNAVAASAVGIAIYWSVAKDGGLALIVGFTKSVLALALAFGLHMAAENQAVIMSFVATAGAMFVRSNVTASVTDTGAIVPPA